MAASSLALSLFDRHRPLLEQAVVAVQKRTFWSPFPESPSPKSYGETAAADGQAAFEARLNRPFLLSQPDQNGQIGSEVSPYGFSLGISYPRSQGQALLQAAQAAMPAWRNAGPAARAGVCLEILARIHKRSFEIAHAVMHTTGQAFMMAFQAGGPHAQDRGP